MRLPGGIVALVGATSLMRPWSAANAQDRTASLLAAERTISEVSQGSGFRQMIKQSLHPQGIVLWPGAPVLVGQADVDRFVAALPADSLHLTWKPLGVEVADDSTLGITWGTAVNVPPGATPSPQIGSYITAWRRDSGHWAISAMAFSGFLLPGAPLASGLALSRRALPATGNTASFVAADLAFARLAGDSGAAVAFERWASPAAVVFGNGGLLIHGPQAIGRTVAGTAAWKWHPVAAGAAHTGDLGWTVGEAVIKPVGGEPVYSKYLTIWTRLRQGGIRFLTDGGNARPKAP